MYTPFMIARFGFRLILFLWLATLPLACQSTPEPEPEPTPDPQTIVNTAVAHLTGVSGFHFILETSGPATYLDADGTLALRRLQGDFAAPDRVRAVVRVAITGLVTELRVIGIGEQQWQTNVLTGAWEPVSVNGSFNPAILFDEAVGLPAILTQELTEVALLGTETVDGVAYEVITAVLDPTRLISMSNGLLGSETTDAIPVQLWLTPDSHQIQRILLSETIPGQEQPRQWQVDFSQFDQAVTIEPPIKP